MKNSYNPNAIQNGNVNNTYLSSNAMGLGGDANLNFNNPMNFRFIRPFFPPPIYYYEVPNINYENENYNNYNQTFIPTNINSQLPCFSSNNINFANKYNEELDNKKKEENEIKFKIKIMEKRIFLSSLNKDLDMLKNNISSDERQNSFDLILLNAQLNYQQYLEKTKNYKLNPIYIKKINEKYYFDYYKFQEYNVEKKIDLLDEISSNKENIIDKTLYDKMKKEMSEECKSNNQKIKLFIFNQYCFLEPQTISVYIPHILKKDHEKDFLSFYIKNKELTIDDFVVDYENNENCLFIKIIKSRLEELNKNYKNSKEYGLGVANNGERGYLYTTIPSELIERSILELDLMNFNSKYYGGYISEKASTIKCALSNEIREEKTNFYEKNEDYLLGMATQELILFFIHQELKVFDNLPRFIAFENLKDIVGNNIYQNKNLNFIEFDSIIESKSDFIYENEKYPLLMQKFFEVNNGSVKEIEIKSNSYFNIKANDIYFFEIKTKLNNSNLNNVLSNIIKNLQTFYDSFISNKICNNKANINLVLIYDFHKIQLKINNIIENAIKLLNITINFNLQIIYCFPNYAYFSFNKISNKVKQLQKEQISLKRENKDLNNKIGDLNNNIGDLNNEIGDLKNQIGDLNNTIDELKFRIKDLEKNHK